MELSIVIVNWNVIKLVLDCLESIEQNPPQVEYDIWVVDNASTDQSIPLIRDRFPHVHIIAKQTNIGFAAANNEAIRQSCGRYVLLLNPDTVVLPGALQEMVGELSRLPQAGAVGSFLQSPDGSMQPSCTPFPTLSREIWRLLHFDFFTPYGKYPMEKWSQTETRSVDALQGASLMIKREVLDVSGLLDTDYFMYSEEVDLCYRIKKHGWKLYWVPRARIIHYGGQSTQQMASKMFLELYRSKILFFRKNYSKRSSENYKSFLGFAAAIRVVGSGLLKFLAPSRKDYFQRISENYRHLLSHLSEM